ncbi:MAG: histidine phosphatase family protein [Clostridia bacterium]|nr:histidine phosphatase family protein [Clostridia bacterium]MBQ5355131.1 histidine phosphatase family protein [Clostridia bacterium]
MFLYIVRHGHPVYGPKEQLTETGRKQARALVPRMVRAGITRIYSSPLRRAIETAEPTAHALGLPIGIEPWCSENLAWSRFTRDLGEGRRTWVWNIDDIGSFVRGENRDAGDRWYEIDAMKTIVNGKDGYAALQGESDEFLARLGYVREGNDYRIERPNDERVAVFCHQGFGLTWLSHLLRIPPNIFWAEFDVTHTGVTVLNFSNRKCGRTVPKCLCLSDMSHLAEDGYADLRYHTHFVI